MAIHKVFIDDSDDFRYFCNQAVSVTDSKASLLWKKVTCKNCLKQRPV